jgi:ABC-type sulfate transport system substrate-binding protein
MLFAAYATAAYGNLYFRIKVAAIVLAGLNALFFHVVTERRIADWNDVATSGTGVLTPDPDQSGGARWNLVSLWGAATRGDVPGISKGDDAAATTLMNGFAANVLAWDSSARGSIQNFEGGNGDHHVREGSRPHRPGPPGHRRSTLPARS